MSTTRYPQLTIKPERESILVNRHPWIFSGALQKAINVDHGAIVHVVNTAGEVLATGTYSATSSIMVRVFAWEEVDLNDAWFVEQIRRSDDQRRLFGYGHGSTTTGYRVVFGEADGLPGLVIDRYGDVIVFQSGTAGIDRLRPSIITALETVFQPRAIIEKSSSPSRKEEELTDCSQQHTGEPITTVPFTENGHHYIADVAEGQKTGFFLDQKELRLSIQRLAFGQAANIFSYTGASSVAALAGKVTHIHNVDVSERALALAEQHRIANAIPLDKWSGETAEVFKWLEQLSEVSYDTIILDPPALIKDKRSVANGRKAYHFLNRAALRLLRDGGILFTSSCSNYFLEEDLVTTVRRAAEQAGVRIRVLQMVRQSPDHPMSVYYPESLYLKSLVVRVYKQ